MSISKENKLALKALAVDARDKACEDCGFQVEIIVVYVALADDRRIATYTTSSLDRSNTLDVLGEIIGQTFNTGN